MFLAEVEVLRSKINETYADPHWWTGGFQLLRWGLIMVSFALAAFARAADIPTISPTLHGFMHDMPRTVRADHPAILPVAAAIRAVTTNPLEQIVMVNDVAHLLIDYDDDLRVYGVPEFYATLDEMIAKRRQQGWLYLRDDCDGRAVFAAHLLASLGISWKLQASYWKRHAWVVARVGGVNYDLLDYRPEATEPSRLAYRLIGHWFVRDSHQPPVFNWRRRWAQRTHQDMMIGLQLGLLAVDSTPANLHERHATDWTEEVPDAYRSPPDPRTLTAATAGFPYGERLVARGLAAGRPTAEENSSTLGAADSNSLLPTLATNSSRNSAPTAPASH